MVDETTISIRTGNSVVEGMLCENETDRCQLSIDDCVNSYKYSHK